MAVGTGYGFDVSELSKALDKLDAQLASIVAQGDAVQKSFKSLFSGNNINWDVLDKVEKMQNAFISLSKTKDPLSWDSTDLRGYIDDVNRLIRTINVLNGAAGFDFFDVKALEKTRGEFKKMLAEVETYEKQIAKGVTAQNQTYAGAMAFSSGAKSMEEERQAIVNLEAAREKLIKTDANYATQLNNINVAIEQHKNSIREAMKTDAQKAEESRKKAEAAQKEAEAQRKANEEAHRSTTVGAMGYSRNAKSLQEIRQAMKYLETARSKEKLDTKESRENYRQLTEELTRQTKTYEGLIGKVAEKQKGLMVVASQLGSKLAAVFSVAQIRGYINKLAQVRGEFELQQRSLQAILQNKNEANEIWNKTTELAVKSPFRVKELTSYTKQLAAYRIESDKLYDTNKMLADVSAGLGVDMQRLILAFGQVKSAEYLRGTELRQFTEAGVPMLAELSRYLSEVKGRSIEVAEVFDMISKRMVTFSDVEEVFKRITSAGGAFYNMQEIQSNTLKGQISNLKDSIDLMLNDLGKATEGTMKNAVGAVKSLVDNYEKLIPVLKTVIALTATYGIHTLSMSKRMLALGRLNGVLLAQGAKGYSVAKMLEISVKTLTRGLIKGIGSIAKFVSTNPWTLLGTVAVGAIAKIVSENKKYQKALEEIDKEHARVAQSLQTIGVGFDKSIDSKNYSQAKEQLTQLIALAEREYNLKFNIEVGKLNEQQVKETFEEIERQLTTVSVKAADFSKSLEQGFTLGDGFTTDLEDLNISSQSAFQSMQSFAISLAYNLQNAKDNGEALTKQQEEALKVIRDGKQDNQSQLDYFESLREAITIIVGDYERYAKEVVSSNGQNKKAVEGLEAITKRLKLLGINIDAIRPLFSLFGVFDKDVEEARKEFDSFIKRLDTKAFASMSEEDLLATLTVAVDTEGANRKWNDFVKDHVKRWLEEVYPIKFKPVVGDGADEALLAWQDSYNKLFEGKNGFETITKNATTHEEVIKRLNGEYKKQKALVDQISKAGTKGAYQGYSLDEEKKKLQEINAQLAWFGTSQKGEKGKDEVLERLKNRINLIKEMNKEYEKLNKTFSKAESLAKVQAAYANTAKELGLDSSKMDFTDEGTIESLEALLGKPEYAANKYVIELQKALDNFKVELGVEVKQESDKELKEQVETLFDRYDLSVELKKLNVPKDLAKSLFDVDYLDLNGLKKAVQDQASKFIGTDMEKEYEDYLKKIGELQKKQQADDAKEFVNFLKKNLNEIQVIQDKGAYNIALADRLFGEGKITAEQYMSSIRQIVEETNKEVAKVNLEKFKNSAIYIKAMGDLAAYSKGELEEMMNALRGQVGENAGNMGADEIREYYDAIGRLVEQYERIESPFSKGEINDLVEYLRLQKELTSEKEKEADLERQRASIESNLTLLKNKLKEQETSGDKVGAEATRTLIKSETQRLESVNGKIVAITSNISVISEKVANLGDGMVKSLVVADKIISEMANVANAATKMFDDIKSAADALGADTESGGWAKAGIAMEMVGGVSSELSQGLSNLASGNFAGALANVVGIVTRLVSGFAKIHDQNYQDIVEAQAEQVERLGKAYSKLEVEIGKAYSLEQLQAANAELEKNIELQIASYEAMIAAEKAKKNTDEDQIKAWNEELESLTQQWKELKESLVSGLGGVDDYRSQTRSFVDAWVSAFQETGNGLDGLKNNFREFFDNIIAEQAALRVTERFLAPFYDKLNAALNDLEFSVDESKALREEADKIVPELSSALEMIWNQLGGSVGKADGAGLSGLQKGIQGITEDTAQIIEAYLNSVRGYVSEQVTHTRNIYRILNDAVHSDAAAIRVRMV